MIYKKITKSILFLILGWLSIFAVNVSVALQYEIFTVCFSFILFLILGNIIPKHFRLMFVLGLAIHVPILYIVNDFQNLPLLFNYFLISAFLSFFLGIVLSRFRSVYNVIISFLIFISFYIVSNHYLLQQHIETFDSEKRLENVELISAKDTISIEDLKGKIVIMELWSSKCGYCKYEYPYMNELNDFYQERDDVVFLLVNPTIDSYNDFQKSVDFFSKNINVPFYYDADTTLSKFLNVNAVPHTIVFDKNMTIKKWFRGFGKVVEANFINNIKETIAEIDAKEHSKKSL